jgi:hypothetical protein
MTRKRKYILSNDIQPEKKSRKISKTNSTKEQRNVEMQTFITANISQPLSWIVNFAIKFKQYTDNIETTQIQAKSFFVRYKYIRFNRELEHNNSRIIARLKQLSPNAPNILATAAILFSTFQNGKNTDELLPYDFTIDNIRDLVQENKLKFTNHHTMRYTISIEQYLCHIYTEMMKIQDQVLESSAINAVKLLKTVRYVGQFTASQLILLLIDANLLKKDPNWAIRGIGSDNMLRVLVSDYPSHTYHDTFFTTMKEANSLCDNLFTNISWEHILCKAGMWAKYLRKNNLDPQSTLPTSFIR